LSNVQPPPIQDMLIDDNKLPNLSWIMFFNNIFQGDTGTNWNPAFTSLTSVGSPTITGRYYQISRNLCYFSIMITPATNTSSVASTTYVNNFPLDVINDGICLAVSSSLSFAGGGYVTASNNRIYTPAWTTVTVPVLIAGIVEAV